MIKVIKRDGEIRDYNKSFIKDAVGKAREEIKCDDINLDILIADEVTKEIQDKNVDKINVEEIQDLVVKYLKVYNPKIEKAYSDYREKRNEYRTKQSAKEKFYTEVLGCTNIDNDNSNVNQHSFSGRKYRIADYEQKMYAIRNLISDEGRKAFENGLIYYHDFSSYAIGEFNCMNLKVENGFKYGFKTRNGDVRPANSFSTACQLLAVMFQCESQCQFGGVGASALDFQLEPYVKISFKKHYIEGLVWFEGFNKEKAKEFVGEDLLSIEDKLYNTYKKVKKYAMYMLQKEGQQSCEGLYHNLNTLESRAGSQLPFTSINTGRNTSPEGRLINQWLFNASIKGIGKGYRTSIFPISIFQYKKGINAHKGEPNYDIKKLAINSLCHRIYPNIVNGDYKQVIEDPNDYNTFFATMG